METLFVFYREVSPSTTTTTATTLDYNVVPIRVMENCEVYLLDVIKEFISLQLNYKYQYYQQIHSQWLHVPSPSSVLFVQPNNNRIYIQLERSSSPPVVPLNQIEIFEILSKNNINNDQENSDYQIEVKENQVYNRPTTATTNQLQRKDVTHKLNPTTVEHAKQQQQQQQQRNESLPPKQPRNNQVNKPPTSQSQQRKSGTATGTTTTTTPVSLVDEQTAAALSAAKKSFFQFAQNSLRTMTEVIETVGVNTATAASALQAAATTTATAATTAGGNSVQIGTYNVTIEHQLAEGGFGIVYLARDNNSSNNNNGQRLYALKKLLIQSKEQMNDAKIELKALKLFMGDHHHEHIIQLLAFTSQQQQQQQHKEVLLLFPYYSQGTAWSAIEAAHPMNVEGQAWPFNERACVHIATQVAYALLAMHEQGLAHRDVKPHNILLTDDGTAVLTDLGSVAAVRVEVTTRQEALALQDDASIKMSAPYRCPELTDISTLQLPFILDERIDVWSLGCCLFCLAFGRSPFETSREGVQKLAILNGRYAAPPGARMRSCVFSEAYLSIIKQLLVVDYSHRPHVPEVISMLEYHLQLLP